MRNISDSKISYYARNKRTFLSNPRYKSSGRVKTKPTFNQLIKETHNQLIEKWGPYMEVTLELSAQIGKNSGLHFLSA